MAETDRIAELERRVRAPEDAREIEALHHRYVRCLADRAWQGCADCYADDAYVLSSPVIHVDGDQPSGSGRGIDTSASSEPRSEPCGSGVRGRRGGTGASTRG